MESTPTVSILLTAYNSAEYISGALESIEYQSFRDFEVVFIDDGSVDNTIEVVKSFFTSHPGINYKLLASPSNLGYAKIKDLAIRHCAGQFVAILDSDDRMHPLRLETQLSLFDKDQSLDLVGTAQRFIFGSSYKLNFPFAQHSQIISSLFTSTTLAHPTIMFRRSFLLDNRILYDNNPSLRYAEDYKLFISFMFAGANFASSHVVYDDYHFASLKPYQDPQRHEEHVACLITLWRSIFDHYNVNWKDRYSGYLLILAHHRDLSLLMFPKLVLFIVWTSIKFCPDPFPRFEFLYCRSRELVIASCLALRPFWIK